MFAEFYLSKPYYKIPTAKGKALRNSSNFHRELLSLISLHFALCTKISRSSAEGWHGFEKARAHVSKIISSISFIFFIGKTELARTKIVKEKSEGEKFLVDGL